MQLLDNKQGRTLGFELHKQIEPDAVFLLRTGLFSIYAFYMLRDKFKLVKEMNISLMTNVITQLPEGVSVTLNPNVWGSDNEREFKQQLLLRRASEECVKILGEKADIQQSKTGVNSGFNLLFVENTSQENCAVMSSSDFTSESLGYTSTSTPQQHAVHTEKEAIQQFYSSLNQMTGPSSMKDVTRLMLEELKRGYKDYTPEEVYYFILHHLFHYSLAGLDDDGVIKYKTGFKEKEIWKKLYKFQKNGVLGAIEKIEKYGGCIIADSVGLGKTFEALAIIKYYELRGHRVLVLCPKKLRDNWVVYTQNDKRNIFLGERFSYKVLNHTDLSRKRGKSGDIDLSTFMWSNFDLVVIDESHNFRNNNPSQKVESRYATMMNKVIKEGVKTKLLMLSATPVNNRMNDLKNQIAFITEGNDFAYETEGIDHISNVMKLTQKQFNEWLKSPKRNIDTLFDRLDERYFKLLDMLTIARSRKHIEKYYKSNDVGQFPTRLKPINVKTDIDTEQMFPSLREINNAIRKMNLANFSPMTYLKSEKIKEYEEKYDYKLRTGSVFRQVDREASLIHLMRVNYLKRMESSIHAFSLSVSALLEQVKDKLYKIEHLADIIDEAITIEDVNIFDDEEEALVGNKVKVLLQDIDLVRWKQDLEYDRQTLAKLLNSATTITPNRDEKLEQLKRMITQKVNSPINDGNKKVIIFTAFADTANYLYKEIAKWAESNFGMYSALIKGSGTNKTNFPNCPTKDMNELLIHFAPISKERHKIAPEFTQEIDILIATDCISEGQNLQDCDFLINYDIHWNPVRIIQRFGRVDRLGSKNTKIQLVNFWPNMELNEYINLENRVKGKMVLLDISATGEENLIEMNESDEMTDLDYRRKQLEQMQEAVLDLEDVKGGVTITDINMNDYRMDINEYEKEHLEELQQTPCGIHTVVPINDDNILPGTIFCMKSNAETKGSSLLAPYYLVYVGEDKSTILGYTHGKRCLDYLKKLCDGQTEVVHELAKQLKEDTKNYSEMSRLSTAFHVAIESVIGKSQEVGAASFFSTELISVESEGVNSKSDFDIIAFVVIKHND